MSGLEDGNQVSVEYGLYYNREKTDDNGTYCDEYVLEKKYPGGTYDTQLVDFYLVNPDTLEVTDEHKKLGKCERIKDNRKEGD